MTNTVAGILSGVTGNFNTAFDTILGIAVVALGCVVVFGMAAKWFGGRRKAG